MKRIWKGVITGLFLSLFLNAISLASDIKKADELFDKGTFQEALKEYEEVFKETADPELRCRLHSFQSLSIFFRSTIVKSPCTSPMSIGLEPDVFIFVASTPPT